MQVAYGFVDEEEAGYDFSFALALLQVRGDGCPVCRIIVFGDRREAHDPAIVHGDAGGAVLADVRRNFSCGRDEIRLRGADLMLTRVQVALGGTGVIVERDTR